MVGKGSRQMMHLKQLLEYFSSIWSIPSIEQGEKAFLE